MYNKDKKWKGSNINMAKGWVKIKTVNDAPKSVMTDAKRKIATQRFENLIRNTKTLSIQGLKKASKEAYVQQKAYEDHLLDAYEGGRLKSEKAKAKAESIKKARAEAEKTEQADKPAKKRVVKKAEKKETSPSK